MSIGAKRATDRQKDKQIIGLLGASEITANPYCNCVYLYWEGCVISSTYLRLYMERSVCFIT